MEETKKHEPILIVDEGPGVSICTNHGPGQDQEHGYEDRYVFRKDRLEAGGELTKGDLIRAMRMGRTFHLRHTHTNKAHVVIGFADDWLIREQGPHGARFIRCTPEVFEKIYEDQGPVFARAHHPTWRWLTNSIDQGPLYVAMANERKPKKPNRFDWCRSIGSIFCDEPALQYQPEGMLESMRKWSERAMTEQSRLVSELLRSRQSYRDPAEDAEKHTALIFGLTRDKEEANNRAMENAKRGKTPYQCPNCMGTGRNPHFSVLGSNPVYHEYNCRSCNGTGVLWE